MIRRLIHFIFLALFFSTGFAAKQSTGLNGDMINSIKQLDVFLIGVLANIDKHQKKPVQLKVMNYGIHKCILMGHAWQEDTANFKALLVETDHLLCGEKKYPAHFFSRVIFDKNLSLNSKTHFGSFAKPGLEIFLIKIK